MGTKRAKPQDGEPSFEQGMAELQSIVERLESGELSLEQALECFERGIQLVASLNGILNAAEERIEVLLRGADGRLRAELEELEEDGGEA